jgi:mannose-1-phosphate guanylyltransferase
LERPVEAVLLVGGQGSRLRPLTSTTPKPMLPCAGVPFLTHQLVRLRDAGISHVVLATSYKAEVFTEYFGDGSALGLAIDYVTEVEPLGTGGAIRNVADLLRGDAGDLVVVLNGDILSGHSLRAQLELHVRAAAQVTLHLVQVPDARAYGCVPTDGKGRVTAFHEKMPEPVSDQVNAGCYVFRRGIIDTIPAGRVVSVERDTFPSLLAAGTRILGYVQNAYWLDLGTPEAFVRGSRDLVTGELPSAAVPVPGEAVIAADAMVGRDATVTGGSAIGAGAVVADGAVVDGSVLFDGAWVSAGASVRDSVVGAGARIGARTSLSGVVVGDNALVGADNELRGGARIWTDAVLPDGTLRFSPDV